ncbi:MAG: hypothetical protein KF764_31525 [Labilithrix sp.]|nr:hypothetical protein [Labilithrix sp.]
MSFVRIITALGQGLLRMEHDDGEGGSAPPANTGNTPAPPRHKSLAEKIAEKKKGKGGRVERTRPILRKLGNDLARTMATPSREVVMLDSRNYTDDGVYILSDEVQEHLIAMGRHKVMFEAEVRLGIDIAGHAFATYAKLDSSDASAAYADAVSASETEWVWLAWDDGLYTWGVAPEPPPKEPVWPVHRTPDQLLEAMLEARTITDVHHPLIERIVLGRR